MLCTLRKLQWMNFKIMTSCITWLSRHNNAKHTSVWRNEDQIAKIVTFEGFWGLQQWGKVPRSFYKSVTGWALFWAALAPDLLLRSLQCPKEISPGTESKWNHVWDERGHFLWRTANRGCMVLCRHYKWKQVNTSFFIYHFLDWRDLTAWKQTEKHVRVGMK